MKRCDRCQMMLLNGVPCHELGCPAVWLEAKDCVECGRAFEPAHRHQRFCEQCWDELFGFGGGDHASN